MKIIMFSLVLLLSTIAAAAQSATVIAEKANLRGTPSAKGKVVDKLSIDQTVEVIKQNGAWFLVQARDYVGWIQGDTIRLNTLTLSSPVTLVPSRAVETTPTYTPPTQSPSARSSPSRTYIKGPRGGCYYINSSGKKTYVDHSYCN